ncbi:MAG: inner membrane protein [Planctomycetota bacterium]|jgi:inner membrane protein
MARARLVRPGPLVTATLVISANAPDVDALAYVFGDSTDALFYRRGWTHSLITFLVQIPLLAGLVYAFGIRRAKGGADAPCWRSLLLASTLGYLSHIALDLLNTYGVRFLLPFDDRWVRGDMAFIVDPWMWLLFGSATLWGGEIRRRGYVLWFVLLGLGGLGMQFRHVPLPAIALWSTLMILSAVLRRLRGTNVSLARASLLIVALYLSGLKAASCAARERGQAVITRHFNGDIEMESTVNPRPAIPWRSRVVVATPNTIFRVPVDLLQAAEEDQISHWFDRNLDDPALSQIRETREYKTWKLFARHPFVLRDGDQIILGDGRYSYGTPESWGNLSLPFSPEPNL